MPLCFFQQRDFLRPRRMRLFALCHAHGENLGGLRVIIRPKVTVYRALVSQSGPFGRAQVLAEFYLGGIALLQGRAFTLHMGRSGMLPDSMRDSELVCASFVSSHLRGSAMPCHAMPGTDTDSSTQGTDGGVGSDMHFASVCLSLGLWCTVDTRNQGLASCLQELGQPCIRPWIGQHGIHLGRSCNRT